MPVDPRPAHPARSTVAATIRGHRADHEAADLEEEERFRRWLDASESVVRAHKDAGGWEEPPRSMLRRLRKRDG
jgi:hypothetical protein